MTGQIHIQLTIANHAIDIALAPTGTGSDLLWTAVPMTRWIDDSLVLQRGDRA